MNNFEKAENESSDKLLAYAVAYAASYVGDPGDLDAAVVALLVCALEKASNREFSIERIWIC